MRSSPSVLQRADRRAIVNQVRSWGPQAWRVTAERLSGQEQGFRVDLACRNGDYVACVLSRPSRVDVDAAHTYAVDGDAERRTHSRRLALGALSRISRGGCS